MKTKSSKAVSLVLITAALASCSKVEERKDKEEAQRIYMRADSSAPYTEVTQQYQSQRSHSSGMGSALLWYMAFRPMMGGGMGYTSNGLHTQSNVGTNTAKANAVKSTQTTRGGFGSTAKGKSSSSSS